MGTKRDEYVSKLKAQLDVWNAQIDRWEAQARKTRAEAGRESEKWLDELRKQRDALRARLPEFQEAGEQAFEDLVDGANRAWREMSRAFDRARGHFKTEEDAASGTAGSAPRLDAPPGPGEGDGAGPSTP